MKLMSFLKNTDWQNTNFSYLSSADKPGVQSSWENQIVVKKKPYYSRHGSKKIPETCVIFVTCF